MYKNNNIKITLLSIILTSFLLSMANAETINKAILRSACVIGSVDFPSTLYSGKQYTIKWMVQSYVPIKSRLQIKYSDNSVTQETGTQYKNEKGGYHIGDYYSYNYYFESTITIPSGKSGNAIVGFHNAQNESTDNKWMYGLFPTGIIERPVGTAGKQFYVTISN